MGPFPSLQGEGMHAKGAGVGTRGDRHMLRPSHVLRRRTPPLIAFGELDPSGDTHRAAEDLPRNHQCVTRS